MPNCLCPICGLIEICCALVTAFRKIGCWVSGNEFIRLGRFASVNRCCDQILTYRAFGSPYQFVFLYRNKSYSSCQPNRKSVRQKSGGTSSAQDPAYISFITAFCLCNSCCFFFFWVRINRGFECRAVSDLSSRTIWTRRSLMHGKTCLRIGLCLPYTIIIGTAFLSFTSL